MKKEYLEIENYLDSLSHKRLAEVECKILHPTEIKREYLEEGEWFFRTQNLRPLKIEDSNNVFISSDDATKLGKNLIQKNDVLITRTGANFGQTAIYNKSTKAIASSHVFILRNTFFNQSFLAVFFNTKFGRKLIDKGMYGGSQPEIAPYYIANIPIPIFSKKFQQTVDGFLKSFEQKEKESLEFYTQAENLLLESLGLNKESLDCHEAKASRNDGVGRFEKEPETPSLRGAQRRGNPDEADKFSHLSINQKSFKESFLKTGRLDAEYYQPKYEKIINQIQSGEYAKLCDLVLIQKSIEPGSEAYLESGLEFIRVANLSKFGISKSEIFLDEKKYSGIIKPKKDTILLSKDGTVGIAYKASEDLNCITSGAILHLTINKTNILPDYLTLVLNSKLVQMQAERDSGGSIIQHWKPSEIMEILIPIIDQKTQSQISSLIRQSFSLKKTSENLLETAKKAVEMAIEESEEKAIKFIKENFES